MTVLLRLLPCWLASEPCVLIPSAVSSQLGPQSLFQPCIKMWVTTSLAVLDQGQQGCREAAPQRAAARGRQRPRLVRSGSAANGRRAPSAEPECCGLPKRPEDARAAGGTGARGPSAFSATTLQELEQRRRGDPGRPPRSVPAEPRAQRGVVGAPCDRLGAGRGRPGVFPGPSLAQAAGWARRDSPSCGDPLPVLPEPGCWSEPCAPPLPQSSGHRPQERGLRARGSPFWGGVPSLPSESSGVGGTQKIAGTGLL